MAALIQVARLPDVVQLGDVCRATCLHSSDLDCRAQDSLDLSPLRPQRHAHAHGPRSCLAPDLRGDRGGQERGLAWLGYLRLLAKSEAMTLCGLNANQNHLGLAAQDARRALRCFLASWQGLCAARRAWIFRPMDSRHLGDVWMSLCQGLGLSFWHALRQKRVSQTFHKRLWLMRAACHA